METGEFVMSSDQAVAPRYDRQLLLGAKRNVVLELWEVLRFGTDMFEDPRYLSIYGMAPDEWYARGVRVLGRTAVECTPDHVADGIGRDVAQLAGSIVADRPVIVVDPFVGSANTLYWILRNLPGAAGVGFELDSQVHQLTRRNLSILGLPIEFVYGDYLSGLRGRQFPEQALVVAFIAPPWGTGFSPGNGLDLRGTSPPVRECCEALVQLLKNRLLLAIQVTESVVPDSLTELTTRADSSALRIYDSNKAGRNRNGLLLLTHRWQPG